MNYVNISETEYCNIVINRIKEYMKKNNLKQKLPYYLAHFCKFVFGEFRFLRYSFCFLRG